MYIYLHMNVDFFSRYNILPHFSSRTGYKELGPVPEKFTKNLIRTSKKGKYSFGLFNFIFLDQITWPIEDFNSDHRFRINQNLIQIVKITQYLFLKISRQEKNSAEPIFIITLVIFSKFANIFPQKLTAKQNVCRNIWGISKNLNQTFLKNLSTWRRIKITLGLRSYHRLARV